MHLMFDSLTPPSCSTPQWKPATLAPLSSLQGRVCQLCVLSNRSRLQGGLGICARGFCISLLQHSQVHTKPSGGGGGSSASRSTMPSLPNIDSSPKEGLFTTVPFEFKRAPHVSRFLRNKGGRRMEGEGKVRKSPVYLGCLSLTRLSACVAEQERV